jgi:stage II sporulation protein D
MAARPHRNRIARLIALLLIGTAGASGLWWLMNDDGIYTPSSRTPTAIQIAIGSAAAEKRRTTAAANARRVESPIRVNLTPTAVSTLRIAVDKSYRIHLPELRREIVPTERLAETKVSATSDGIQIGRRQFRVKTLDIIPAQSPAIWINNHQYRGTIRLHRLESGKLIAVNILPLHHYLASVVDSEMPTAFPRAAREAQTIVSRTYALHQMSNRHPRFDLFSTTRSQNYLGYQYRDRNGRRLAGESESSRRVVRATAGEVCTRNGRLIPTYYSAVCGGTTTPGGDVFRDASDLASVRCTGCRDAKLYRWTAKVDRAAAAQAFQNYFRRTGKSFETLTSVSVLPQKNGSGQRYFHVGDGRRKYRLAAVTLRREVFPSQLHSSRFEMRLTDKGLRFHGRGSGHGVGLCQWGARGLALSGKNSQEIVRHYYPETVIIKLSKTRIAQATRITD